MSETPEPLSRAETVEPEVETTDAVQLFGQEYADTEPLDDPIEVKHQLRHAQTVLVFTDINEQFDGALFALDSKPEIESNVELQIEAVGVLSEMLNKFHEVTLVKFFEAGHEFPEEDCKFFFLKLLFFLCRCVQRVERALNSCLKDVCAEESGRHTDELHELANGWYMRKSKQQEWLKILREVLRSVPARLVDGASTVMEAVFSQPPAAVEPDEPDDAMEVEKTADRKRYEKILDVILAVLIDGLRPLEIVAEQRFKTLQKLYFIVLLSLATDHHHATQVASELLSLAADHEYITTNKRFVFVDFILHVPNDAPAAEPLLVALLKCALKTVDKKASQLLIARLAEKQVDVLYAHLSKLMPALRKKMPSMDSLTVIDAIVRECLATCDTREKFYEREALLLIVWDRIHDESSFVRARALKTWKVFFKEGLVPVHWHLSPLMRDAFECVAESSQKNVRMAATGLLCQMAARKPFGDDLNVNHLFEKLVKTNQEAEPKLLERSHTRCFELDEERTKAIWKQLVDRLKALNGMRPPKAPAHNEDFHALKTPDAREQLLDEISKKFAEMRTENGETNDPNQKPLTDVIKTQMKSADQRMSAKISEAFEYYGWCVPKNYQAVAHSKELMSLRFPEVALDLIHSDNLELACSNFLDYVLDNKLMKIDKDSCVEEIVDDLHKFALQILNARAQEEHVMSRNLLYSQMRHDTEFFYRRLMLALHHSLDWEEGLPILSHVIPEASAEELPRLLELLKLLYGLRVRETHSYLQKATDLAWDPDGSKALANTLKEIFYAPPPPDGNETKTMEQTCVNLIRFMRDVSPRYRHSVCQALTIMFQVHPLTRTIFFVLEPECQTKPDDAERAHYAAMVTECAVRSMPDQFTDLLGRWETTHAKAPFKIKPAMLRVFVAYNSAKRADFPAVDRRVFFPPNSPLVDRVLKNLVEELEVSNEQAWKRYAVEAVHFAFTCCRRPLDFCTAAMDFIFRRGRVRMQKVHSCRQMKQLCDQLLSESSDDPELQEQMLKKADELFEEHCSSSAAQEEPTATSRSWHRNAYEVEDIDSENEEYTSLVRTPVQPDQVAPVQNSRLNALITRRLYVAAICETENRVLESTLRRLFFVGGEILLRLLTFYGETIPFEINYRMGAANYVKNASLFEIQTLYRHRMIQSGPEYKEAVFDKREKRVLTKLEKDSLTRRGLFDRPEQQQGTDGGGEVDVWNEEFLLTFEENFFRPKSLFGRLMPIVFSVLRVEEHYAPATVHAARMCLGKMMLANVMVCREWCDVFFTFFKDAPAEHREEYLILYFDMFYRYYSLVEKYMNDVLAMRVVLPILFNHPFFFRLEDPAPNVRMTCFILMSFMIKQNLSLSWHRLSWMSLCLVDEDEEIRKHARAFFAQTDHVETIITFLLPIVIEKLSQPKEKTKQYRARFFTIFRDLKDTDHLMANYIAIAMRVLFECRKSGGPKDEDENDPTKDWFTMLKEEFASFSPFLHLDIVNTNIARICASFRPTAKDKKFREKEAKEITQFQNKIKNAHPQSRARKQVQTPAPDQNAASVWEEVLIPEGEREAELARQAMEQRDQQVREQEAKKAGERQQRGQRKRKAAKRTGGPAKKRRAYIESEDEEKGEMDIDRERDDDEESESQTSRATRRKLAKKPAPKRPQLATKALSSTPQMATKVLRSTSRVKREQDEDEEEDDDDEEEDASSSPSTSEPPTTSTAASKFGKPGPGMKQVARKKCDTSSRTDNQARMGVGNLPASAYTLRRKK